MAKQLAGFFCVSANKCIRLSIRINHYFYRSKNHKG